jgi:hypothetical protein
MESIIIETDVFRNRGAVMAKKLEPINLELQKLVK